MFEPKTNIYLVNNSLLYAVDKVSLASSNDPPIVVLAPFWLERVDDRFLGNTWGQTPSGLPAVTREIFQELYPSHPQADLVTWGQIQEVRKKQIEYLKDLNIKRRIRLFDLREEDIRKFEKGGLLDFKPDSSDNTFVMRKLGQELFRIPQDRLNKVYNYLTVPAEMSEPLKEKGFPQRPHTELYYRGASIPKTLVLSGTGLSTVWIKKHFPESLLIVISQDPSRELPRISSNDGVDYDSITLVTGESILLDGSARGQYLIRIKGQRDSSGIDHIAINPGVSYFSAIGYSPLLNLTEFIPKDKVLTLAAERGSGRQWVAPENLPLGALPHRLLKFYHESQQYQAFGDCFEMEFYIDNVTPKELQKRMAKVGCPIKDDFFPIIERTIRALKHPHSTVEEEQEFYAQAYREYIKNDMQREPTPEEIEVLKQTVKEMQIEIATRCLRQVDAPEAGVPEPMEGVVGTGGPELEAEMQEIGAAEEKFHGAMGQDPPVAVAVESASVPLRWIGQRATQEQTERSQEKDQDLSRLPGP